MVLSDVLNGLPGRKVPRSGSPLMDVLVARVLDHGMGCFLGKFTNAGLGAQANSWVGTGPNLPLASDDVVRAFGSEAVDAVARDAGVSRYQATHGLADMVPGLVDQLTPTGTVPTGNLAASMKGVDFSSILGG
jgi:uncharacterized protein YidB (DUF937 family)